LKTGLFEFALGNSVESGLMGIEAGEVVMASNGYEWLQKTTKSYVHGDLGMGTKNKSTTNF
jgi:hypothetical protein